MCGVVHPLSKSGGSRQVQHCSLTCQKADWKAHNVICMERAKANLRKNSDNGTKAATVLALSSVFGSLLEQRSGSPDVAANALWRFANEPLRVC